MISLVEPLALPTTPLRRPFCTACQNQRVLVGYEWINGREEDVYSSCPECVLGGDFDDYDDRELEEGRSAAAAFSDGMYEGLGLGSVRL